jgi:alanine racemase
MRFVHRPIVRIDLSRVRNAGQAIAHRTGVPVIAVVKADAYGLGAREVVTALREVPGVAGFYCFSLREAVDAGTWKSGKPTICLIGFERETASEYREYHARPAVWDAQRAHDLRAARPVLCVDTGMQRFACPRDRIDEVIAAGACDEAFTHAVALEQAKRLSDWCVGRGLRLHAAGSALLDQPDAWLDFVRPGLALYHDAVRVSARLVEARDSAGPAGYTGFASPTGRHGVIIGGYAHRLRAGAPCRINGEPRTIVECGMQTSFVEIGKNDREGDEVVLLGDGITPEQVAAAWSVSTPQALMSLALCGRREYVNP